MTDLAIESAVARARARATELAKLGDRWAKQGTTERHRLLHLHYHRLAFLVFGALTLIEARNAPAAFALDKSILDTLFGGLYVGYAIKESALRENVAKGGRGRATRHPSWSKMANAVDDQHHRKKPFFKHQPSGSLLGFMDRYGEQANIFQHGSLFAVVLQSKDIPSQLLENFARRCVGTMSTYLLYVAMFEGLPIDGLSISDR